MLAIDEIREAHSAQRRRMVAKRRLIVPHAMIAALKRDRAALIEQQRQLRCLENRVYGNFAPHCISGNGGSDV
jgi:hypothetical protein